MDENDIGTVIVDCAVKLHQDLGPGLLETVYEVTLAHKLKARGLAVERQVAVIITRTINGPPLMISPCLCVSVRKTIEQGGQPDAFGAGCLGRSITEKVSHGGTETRRWMRTTLVP
jgi:hypothetical protein